MHSVQPDWRLADRSHRGRTSQATFLVNFLQRFYTDFISIAYDMRPEGRQERVLKMTCARLGRFTSAFVMRGFLPVVISTIFRATMESRTLIVEFNSAARKGLPFTGWAGSVRDWQEKKAPHVNFGKWHKDRNGGSVALDCTPYALIMWGINSRAMRMSSKTASFAFAGLAADGNLWAAPLPRDTDPYQTFLAGGWIPPTPESIAQQILEIEIDASSPEAGKMLIERIVENAWARLGIKRGQAIGALLPAWPHLEPIAAALLIKGKDWQKS